MAKPGIVAATGERIKVPISLGGTDPELNLVEERLEPGIVAATGEVIKVPVSLGGTDPELYQDPYVPTAILPEKLGFFDRMADVVTGRLRKTEEIKGVPELITTTRSTKSLKKDLKVIAGLMFASGDEAKKDIIKENFKDVKIHEDEHGTAIIEFPDGETAVLNKPGFSMQDMVEVLGGITAFYGPTKLAGLAKGLWKKAAIGSIGAATTEAGLEKGGQFLGSKQEVSPASIATAGGLGAVGELVPGVAGRIVTGRRARKLGAIADETDAVDDVVTGYIEGQKVSEKSGIPLFRAQKTLDPTDLKRQEYIATLPGAAKLAAAKLKMQNEVAYDQVFKVLDQIAPAGKVSYAPERIKNAAKLAIKARDTLRSEAASPFYKEAFKDKKFYSTKKTRGEIDKLLKKYTSGKTRRALLKARKSLIATTEKGKPLTRGLNIEQMHTAKVELGDILTDPKITRNTKRELVKVKKTLLEEIEGRNPAYAKARKLFAEKSPAVRELEESIIGKIAKLDDTQLKRVTSMLYDPKEYAVNPILVKRYKQVIEEQDPQAWRDITRTHFENLLSVNIDEPVAIVENIPNQLYKQLFKNVFKRKVLEAGLDKDVAKNVRYLRLGLKRAGLARPVKGFEATGKMVEEELKGVGGAIRKFFKAPITTGLELGESRVYNQKVKALGKVLFNEKWKPDMKELRRLSPDSLQTEKKFTKILKRAFNELGKPALQTLRPSLTTENFKTE